MRPRYAITFPTDRLSQDEEWCVVRGPGWERTLRLHDYGEIYEIPGLYEQLFYEELECRSPETVVDLLAGELDKQGIDAASLRVLDVGAGNGIVGERLDAMGVEEIVGVDLVPQAEAAARRDRPEIYADYVVADLTDMDGEERERLERRDLNALTCVAALGFGDIPPEAFAHAYDMLPGDGFLGFCIKEEFLDGGAPFADLIQDLLDRDMIEVHDTTRYRHRLSAAGEPLFYVAMAAQKRTPASATDILED